MKKHQKSQSRANEFESDVATTFWTFFYWKLAGIVKLSDNVNLRAAASTGFRAPSLAQIYYNLKFTNYIDNKPVESFLIEHINEPRWHLVIQFIAGLIGDKIRELNEDRNTSERYG